MIKLRKEAQLIFEKQEIIEMLERRYNVGIETLRVEENQFIAVVKQQEKKEQ